MKRPRDDGGSDNSGKGRVESISGTEAMRRLRTMALASGVHSFRDGLNGERETPRFSKAVMPVKVARADGGAVELPSSQPSSSPSTPYLIQRLTDLNGSSFAQAAAALRRSTGSSEQRDSSTGGERATFTAQRMRAAAVQPSAAVTTGHSSDEGVLSRLLRSEHRRPIDDEPHFGNEESQGSVRSPPRKRASVEQPRSSHLPELGSSAPDAVGAVAARAVMAKHQPPQGHAQPARRAPPRGRAAAVAKRAARRPPRSFVVAPPKPGAVASPPQEQRGVSPPRAGAGNSPRVSTGSSSLFDSLATPLRNKARDVESFLERAARMAEEDADGISAAPLNGLSGSVVVPLSAVSQSSPPIRSYSSAFRHSTMSMGAEGDGQPSTLTRMRLTATLPATPAVLTGHSYNTGETASGDVSARGGRRSGIPLPRSAHSSKLPPPSTAAGATHNTTHSEKVLGVGVSEALMAGQRAAGSISVITPGVASTSRARGGGSGTAGRLVVIDTSSLLNSEPGVLNLLTEKWTLCIPFTVVDELDNISKGKPGSAGQQRGARETLASVRQEMGSEWIRHRARELRDWIASALARKDIHVRVQRRSEVVDEYDRTARNNDDAILGFAVYLVNKGERHVMFVTDDKFLKVKAQSELGECYCYNDIRRMVGVKL